MSRSDRAVLRELLREGRHEVKGDNVPIAFVRLAHERLVTITYPPMGAPFVEPTELAKGGASNG